MTHPRRWLYPLACLLAVTAVGFWFHRIGADSRRPISSTGLGDESELRNWPFTTGINSGPAASVEQPEWLGNNQGRPSFPINVDPDLPQTEWFPEAIEPVAVVDADSVADSGPAGSSDAGSVVVASQPLTNDEKRIWLEELGGMDERATDEILALRRQLGSVARETLGILDAPGFTISADDGSATPAAAHRPDDEPNVRPGLSSQAAAQPPRRFDPPAESDMRPVLAAITDPELHPASAELRSTSQQPAGFRPSANPSVLPLQDELNAVFDTNIRNALTLGYRRQELVVLSASAGEAGIRWIRRTSMIPGRLSETGNPLDVAIVGPGWFQVEDAQQKVWYSRAGLLAVTADNTLGLHTAAGVLPLSPKISLPAEPYHGFEIQTDGSITVTLDSSAEPDDDAAATTESASKSTSCGRIQLFAPLDPSLLTLAPNGLYQTGESAASNSVQLAGGQLRQFHLESSNVDPQVEQQTWQSLHAVVEQLSTRAAR